MLAHVRFCLCLGLISSPSCKAGCVPSRLIQHKGGIAWSRSPLCVFPVITWQVYMKLCGDALVGIASE